MKTLYDVIAQVNKLKPNLYDEIDMVNWLSDIDLLIYKEVIETHEDPPVESFTGYDAQTDIHSTEVLVEPPYDELYRWYLETQIDLTNHEVDKYNRSVMLFKSALADFKAYYNRTHLPKSGTANWKVVQC